MGAKAHEPFGSDPVSFGLDPAHCGRRVREAILAGELYAFAGIPKGRADELKALPKSEQISTFHCVTGWTVDNVHWAGVRFQQLIDLVEPLPDATAVRFISLERPYEDSLTLAQLRAPDAMLAYELDGQPLSRPHGAPARVVFPEMYGYKGVKWLNKITVLDQPFDGYWENRGYDRNAWIGHHA